MLLYFLKLKRQEQVVSSTFLWKRAVQDLQVNAPFQRLRRNILLLLQLLALLAVLLALAGPILALSTGAGKRHVILIDRSASMSATDGDPEGRQTRSRLAEAKRRAQQTVDSLRDRSLFSLTDRPDQAMVVAFDEAAVVVCSFTEDKQKLKHA
ncbi:MAG: VWA domain-containing protein, partial [Planctomycetes bacterium]|nr:VWA domain-containing protein [Planctomycetota bacterium]